MSVDLVGSLPLVPIAIGLCALALALVRISAWVAVGAWLAPDVDDAAALPASVIIGAALTGACYAVGVWVGEIGVALVADGLIAAIAVAANWRIVWRHGVALVAHVRTALGHDWTARAVALAWTTWACLVATAPPRDADVLRYHLAHIRQIVLEGRWTRIADTAYAPPFGWSLTYLPFEILHVGVGPQMVNLIVWCITMLAVHRELDDRDSPRLGWLTLLLACQPMVFKAATTAHADAYTMMLVAVVAILVGRGRRLTTGAALMVGFTAWIGAQSRYQALGIGAAATVVFVALAATHAVRGRAVAAAVGGTVGALVLAAPFYVANMWWFGDPVWPLLVPARGSLATATDRVAQVLAQRTVEPLAWHWLPSGLLRLATDLTVFPIPWLVAAAVLVGWRRPATRWVAAFVSAYLVIWALVEPTLFPRFIIFLVPAVPLLFGLGRGEEQPVRRGVLERLATRRLITGSLAFAAGCAALSIGVLNVEAARYTLTGDRERYERATWFAPVFRWADDSLPRDARVLVVVKSGATYWLNRPYRRADPEGSAEIDWSGIANGIALADRLRAAGFRYVIYDDRDWSRYPGGVQMMDLVRQAARQGALRAVTTFPLRLVTSRLLHRSVADTVRVWEVEGAGNDARQESGTDSGPGRRASEQSLPHPGTTH